jgi:hypothetical protein
MSRMRVTVWSLAVHRLHRRMGQSKRFTVTVRRAAISSATRIQSGERLA